MSKPKRAETADRHQLYQLSVQDPVAEMDFVEETFLALRGRAPTVLREDFCGTAFSACEWVARNPAHRAIGVDLDREVLDWGIQHNLAQLKPAEQERIDLRCEDVTTTDVTDLDVVLAMNFSYYLFPTRPEMLRYFRAVRGALKADGLFLLDAYGGYDAHRDITEEREVSGFTYVWEQANFNPINHMMDCFIHFRFPDGSKMDRAFVYPWRLWTLPEIRELLGEAGFSDTRVHWEGLDEATGEGNGIFTETEDGSADAGWICYIVAIPDQRQASQALL